MFKSFLPKILNKKIASNTSITKTNWSNICIIISDLLSIFDLPYSITAEIENEEVTSNIIKVRNTITGTKIHTKNPQGKMESIPTNPVHIAKLIIKNGIDRSLINNIIFRISLRTLGRFCVLIASLIENTILIILITNNISPDNANKVLLLEKQNNEKKPYSVIKNAELKNNFTSQSPFIFDFIYHTSTKSPT